MALRASAPDVNQADPLTRRNVYSHTRVNLEGADCFGLVSGMGPPAVMPFVVVDSLPPSPHLTDLMTSPNSLPPSIIIKCNFFMLKDYDEFLLCIPYVMIWALVVGVLMAEKFKEAIFHICSWFNDQIAISVARLYSLMI